MKKQISALMLGSLLIGNSACAEFNSENTAKAASFILGGATTYFLTKDVNAHGVNTQNIGGSVLGYALTLIAVGYAGKDGTGVILAGSSALLGSIMALLSKIHSN